ncbi:MAG: GNAT family N-acetyltransferase [Deltaproteobacteria bacterium]|nr:GNAT family N-acetyltransferase [Deltaproteobacteria bacterium]
MTAAVKIRILKQASYEDLTTLQKVIEAAPSYWMRISARLPGRNAAEETFKALPDGKSYVDKFVLGVFDSEGAMIGCADLIRGFPNEETAMLGLLLISEPAQKKGYGKLTYEGIERLILSWKEIRKIRIGVIGTNEVVLPFWKSLGFLETGLRRPYEENGVISENIILEKAVS